MTDDPIELKPVVPEGCKVVGALYDEAQDETGVNDVLQVTLPNGIVVDLEWQPGRFYVTAFREHWENRLHREAADTPQEAIEIVERCVRELYTTKGQAE